MALRAKDRLIQARCLQGFADIYRSKSDVDVSIGRCDPSPTPPLPLPLFSLGTTVIRGMDEWNGLLNVDIPFDITAHMTNLSPACPLLRFFPFPLHPLTSVILYRHLLWVVWRVTLINL